MSAASRSIGIMSITPFSAEGEVDEEELRRHLQRFTAHDISVYVCSQGSGEGLSLSLDEKEAVYRAAVATLGGIREVVGAGIGLTGDTATAREQVERLSVTGVDAVQVFPPRTGAVRPRDREIERYFDEVIAGAGCPVIVGENVTLVGYEMGPRLIHRIVEGNDAITGLSYTAARSLGQLVELVAPWAAGCRSDPDGSIILSTWLLWGRPGCCASTATWRPACSPQPGRRRIREAPTCLSYGTR